MELRNEICFSRRSHLPEVRCPRCRRLLFCGKAEQIEIKCPKCNLLQRISGEKQCLIRWHKEFEGKTVNPSSKNSN